jgi:4'-phosphopantetheinyl transferase EntD
LLPIFFQIKNPNFTVIAVDLNDESIGIKKNDSFSEKYQIGRIELLKQIGENPDQYLKDSNGKPTLFNSKQEISFSHSKNLMAIQSSQSFSPGIDVEKMREKIIPISKRFLDNSEKFDNSLEALHILWGAKEAIYKHWSKRALSLIEDIRIQPFEKKNNGKIYGKLFPNQKNERQIELKYHILDGFCLVYITQVT